MVMKNDARLDLRLPQDLKDRVEEVADNRGVNAWVREAIQHRLVARDAMVEVGQIMAPDPAIVKRHRERIERAKKTKPGVDALKQIDKRREVEEIPLPKIAPRRWGK